MTDFCDAVVQWVETKENLTTSDKGDVAFKSTLDPLMDLVGSMGALRGEPDRFLKYFKKTLETTPREAIAALFKLRDIKTGLGERDLFRAGMRYIESIIDSKDIEQFIYPIVKYGRVDDLWLSFQYRETLDIIVDYIYEVEQANPNNDFFNGILCKWLPRNPKNKNEQYLVSRLRSKFKMSPKAWRQFLHARSLPIESLMCEKQWDKINYNHVPSQAMHKFKKAFQRNDETRYLEWVQAVAENLAKPKEEQDKSIKVNAGTLYPYQIMNYKAVYGNDQTTLDLQLAQWDSLPDFFKGREAKILPMIDVSGSMMALIHKSTVTCMDVAVSLGYYCANKNQGAFHDVYLTFSRRPKLAKIRDIDEKGNRIPLNNICKDIIGYDAGLETNIDLAMDELLAACVHFKMKQEDIPEAILIFSDMNFDNYSIKCSDNFLKRAEDKFKEHGYTCPKVVLWNLNHNGTFACTKTDKGAIELSGFSPSLIEDVLSNLNDFTPEKFVLNSLKPYLDLMSNFNFNLTPSEALSKRKLVSEYKPSDPKYSRLMARLDALEAKFK